MMSEVRPHKYALKGNNYACEEECVRCSKVFEVGVNYVITTDDAYQFLCDDCARQEVPELLAVRSVVNDLAHLHEGYRVRGEVLKVLRKKAEQAGITVP